MKLSALRNPGPPLHELIQAKDQMRACVHLLRLAHVHKLRSRGRAATFTHVHTYTCCREEQAKQAEARAGAEAKQQHAQEHVLTHTQINTRTHPQGGAGETGRGACRSRGQAAASGQQPPSRPTTCHSRWRGGPTPPSVLSCEEAWTHAQYEHRLILVPHPPLPHQFSAAKKPGHMRMSTGSY